MLAQMIVASPVQSAAFDEGYTVTYGYAYLRTGEARLSRGQNPPLTNVLLALPLLLRTDIVFPIEHSTWSTGDVYGFSDEFLWKANSDPQRLVMLARLPEMGLALLLACVIYAFTRSMFDRRAALAALFLCAFDPNVLAQGHIAGTDLGVTLFMFSSVWMLTLAIKRMSLRHVIVAGLLAGAALASKYSAVWLGPIALIVGLTYPSAGAKHGDIARLKLLVLFGLAAFVVIWATFGFSFGSIGPNGPAVPAPDYWASLGKVANRVESGTPAFMLGQISSTGFVGYYPFVLLIKTPLPILIFLLMGLVSLIVRRDRKSIALWLPPLLFLIAAMSSNLSLGYRLILPVLPFALVIAGQGTNAVLTSVGTLKRKGSPASVFVSLRLGVCVVLPAWLVIDVLSIGPNHLAYFNQLAGDHTHDYNRLVDSNLDWGQDLIALREWMTANRVDSINLAYFGTAHPSAYGLQANLLPSFTLNDFGAEVDGFSANALPPGWYAISATSLQLGLVYSHWNEYAPFRTREPAARIGRSILVYHIDYPSAETDRAVVLGPVTGDLDRATLGGQPDRQLIVKWAGNDAAVLDMQGSARYITRGGESIAGFASEVHNALLAHGQRLGSDASGQLRLWTIDARLAVNDVLKTLETKPVFMPDGPAVKLPLKFEGGLSLVGYELAAEQDRPMELVTYWRVDQTPDRPLAIFAHLLAASRQIMAQRDGLNVRLSSLEAGDIILQHFTLEHPAAARVLEIGLYDPSDGQLKLADQTMDRVELIWK